MTSRKSFINNFGYAYRTGLRDNIVPAILQFILGAYFFIYTPAIILFKKMGTNPQTGDMEAIKIKEIYQFMLSANMEFFQYFLIGSFLIIGIIMGIVTFKFMTGKKTMNVYYSLGIKRVNMFTAKYLSGLTLMAIAVFVPLLIDVIMNVSAIGMSGHLISSALYYFLGLFSLSMFSFSVTAAVFSMVGTSFEGIVFSGILVSTPAILLSSLQTLIENLVSGTPYGVSFVNSYGNEQSMLSTFYQFTPFMYLSRGLFTYESADTKGQITNYADSATMAWKSPEILLVLAWIAVAVAIMFLAMYLYNRRKAEIGGFIGKNKILNFICTFIIGFFGFVTVISVTGGSSLSTLVRVLIALAVFTVIYIVLDMLLIRNLKLFFKGLYKLPIHLGVALLIFAFFATGYFGAANKVPKTEDIAYAQISSVATGYSETIASPENYYSSLGSIQFTPNKNPEGKYESASDIAKIQEIHKLLVGKMPLTANDINESIDNNYPSYVKIIYTLKNGKEIKRAYYGVDAETYNKLLDLQETDYQKDRLKEAFYGEYKTQYSAEDIKKIRDELTSGQNTAFAEYNNNQYRRALQSDESLVVFSNKVLQGKELVLTTAQRKELLDCLYNDVSNMTAQQIYYPKEALGILEFSAPQVDLSDSEKQMNYQYEGTTMASSDSEESTVYKDGYSTFLDDGNLSISNKPVFFLSPDMTKTIAFLKSIGAYDSVLKTNPQISKAKVYKLEAEFGYLDWYISGRHEIGKEFVVSKQYGDYSVIVGSEISDTEIINTLYSKAKDRAIISADNGYVVTFLVDGEPQMLYVDAEDVPQSIKDKADAQHDTMMKNF